VQLPSTLKKSRQNKELSAGKSGGKSPKNNQSQNRSDQSISLASSSLKKKSRASYGLAGSSGKKHTTSLSKNSGLSL